MFEILLLVVSFSSILSCESAKTSNVGNDLENRIDYSAVAGAAREIPSCGNLKICKAISAITGSSRGTFPKSFPQTSNYETTSSDPRERSYYNAYGTPTTAAYYPAFDPLSVLASLAFLAFLLQTFASLFDRSRSILSTTVAARRSTESDTAGITRRVLRALEKYVSNLSNFRNSAYANETTLKSDA